MCPHVLVAVDVLCGLVEAEGTPRKGNLLIQALNFMLRGAPGQKFAEFHVYVKINFLIFLFEFLARQIYGGTMAANFSCWSQNPVLLQVFVSGDYGAIMAATPRT